MAKVGIMSMQRIVNYGSFLQAYGLKTMLENLGHEVQFVDYHVGKPLIDVEKKINAGVLGKLYKVLEVLNYSAPLRQRIQFILFKIRFASKYNKFLGITEQANYTSKLDMLIIGSDEVFNCVQQNMSVGYSLELFGKNNQASRLITYAASFGNTTLFKLRQYKKTEEIGSLLNKFYAISVRDENSAILVERLSEKKVEYHLDPVLVYDFMGECGYIPEINPKERYLILYAYSNRISQNEAEWISNYAKKKKLRIYAIGGVQNCADKFIDCSPFTVLSYFLHAEEVITDTFHGTIFSIITKKQFVSIVRKSINNLYGNEEKLIDLLKRLDLSTRITYSIEKIPEIQEIIIDYGTVDAIIASEREKTQRYLEQMCNIGKNVDSTNIIQVENKKRY